MKKRKALLSIVLAIVMAISTFTGFVPGTCLKVQAEGTTYSPASGYKDYGALNSNSTTVQIEGVKIGDTIVDWYVINYNSTNQTVTLLSKQSFARKPFNSDTSKGHDYASSEIKTYVEGLTGENQPLAGIKDALADISENVEGNPDNISGAVPYLLSTTEATELDSTKKGTDTWWLRSPGDYGEDAACVHDRSVGVIGGIVNIAFAVRPALQLNLSSVIFSSDTKTFGVGS